MKESLQDRLNKSVSSAAPSLTPKGREEKPKYEAEVLPDMQEVITNPATRLKLLRLVEESASYAAEQRKINAKRKPIQEAIKLELGSTPVKFMCDENRVVYYKIPRKKLSAQKLMTLCGVTPAQIMMCTEISDSWNLKITPPGESNDEEDTDE